MKEAFLSVHLPPLQKVVSLTAQLVSTVLSPSDKLITPSFCYCLFILFSSLWSSIILLLIPFVEKNCSTSRYCLRFDVVPSIARKLSGADLPLILTKPYNFSLHQGYFPKTSLIFLTHKWCSPQDIGDLHQYLCCLKLQLVMLSMLNYWTKVYFNWLNVVQNSQLCVSCHLCL